MPKIKIHVYPILPDTYFLNIIMGIVDIQYYNNLDDIFIHDQFNIPATTMSMVMNNKDKILNYLSTSSRNRLIILDMYEGFCKEHYIHFGLGQYMENQQILLICSADSDYHNSVNIDYCLSLVGQDKNNCISSANYFENIFDNSSKTHNFLFLNKNSKSHRKQLIKDFTDRKLLKDALWSDLSSGITISDSNAVDFFLPSSRQKAISLLGHEPPWPDGVLFPDLYIKTYFSVVTETFFDNPNIFITEKTYKPIMMGHPFIIASSAGFYQKLHDLGYKTFDGLIDESFDKIPDNDKRLLAIADAVENIANSDLALFLKNARPICEHNREHFFKEFGLYPLTTYNKLATFIKNICPN